ncbi:MAG: NAD(P)-binding domain-containing protein [Pseudobdellovibrionaceae bacterium]
MVIKVLQFVVDHLFFTFSIVAGFFVFLHVSKRNRQAKIAQRLLNKAVQAQMHEPLTLHPEIDPALCAGCGACTKVCPEGDILKMINNQAVLVSPTKCVGHGECERACPFSAIKLVFGTKTRGMDIPRVNTNYETNVAGLYIAGELGGMGLIRNAIRQGAMAAEDAIKNLGHEVADYDLLIVGAGPAGLAASLAAIAAKKKYLTLEQNSFGGTIANFPRQKVVMSQPFHLPIVGKMKFNSNKVSKEELLGYWGEVKLKTGLKIKENTQFIELKKDGPIFDVKTSQGNFTAKKVILAMGVRGSPRTLDIPGETLPKVTYNLIDPEQYQRKNIIVVGGGNAGVEAAQMLAEQRWNNKVHLLVRSANFDRCNEDNINRISQLEKKGRVVIWFNSILQRVEENKVEIKKEDQVFELPNDYVFIYAGALLPYKFLMGLGVQIDKKFGQGLSG